MARQSDIVTRASEFVSELFENHLSPDLVYHTYAHTETVAETAAKLGRGMKLGEEGIEVVRLAAWLHDTGYTEIYAGHEEVSIRIAKDFLRQESYPEEKTRLVAGCIRATKIPQRPKNLLEEIVADADLAGLGRKSFFALSDLLHSEWETALQIHHTDVEWMKQNTRLLSNHTFFTPYAKELFGRRQYENLEVLKSKLRELNESDPRELSPHENSHPLGSEAQDQNSTQMIFKLVSNTLMMESLSADHKALMLILSNSILLALSMLGLIVTKIIGHDVMSVHLVFALLAILSIITISLAIRALKQRTGPEDDEAQSQPLPLFGDFSAMAYEEFDLRMKEMKSGNDLHLYGSMTREYFDQRLLVARKYHFIRLSYATFMYGLCLTMVIAVVLLLSQ